MSVTATEAKYLRVVAREIIEALDPFLPLHADGIDTADLIGLRLALKGDPRTEGDKGAIGALSDLARDVDTELAGRMDRRTEDHDGWRMERYSGGSWTFDAPRLLSEYLPRALQAKAVSDDGEIERPDLLNLSPEVIHAVTEAVLALVDVGRNARTTPIKEAFGDQDAPSKFGEKGQGRPSLKVTWIGEA